MFSARHLVAILAFACLLVGCGSGGTEEARKPPPPVKDTAFGDMVGTMDKARGVEDTTMQHKRDMDAAIESQEGSSNH
jgi:hypothetical protein